MGIKSCIQKGVLVTFGKHHEEQTIAYLWVATFLNASSSNTIPTRNTDQTCPQILDLGSVS